MENNTVPPSGTNPRPIFVDEGEAFSALNRSRSVERYDVIVIGGGQTGLSVGYFLKKRGLRFLILEASDRVGDVWRKRWDSLRLFTPARLDSLAGMPFPAPPYSFPTKDEMADYLEAYASRFSLPVRTGMRVRCLSQQNGGYVVDAGDARFEASHVVVAMATYQRPSVPAFAAKLASDVVQLHSSDYRSPSQLRKGGVLVVGAGNSGAEIALELARRGHDTWVSGRDTGQVPFRVDGFWGRLLLVRFVLRVVFHRILTIKTPMGRRARPKMIHNGMPLIRTKRAHLTAAGVKYGPKVAAIEDGRPVLEDGRALDVANVIWCTGFHPGFSWIDLPIFDKTGDPRHDGGVAECEGLYFVGLNFLYAFSSTMIHGAERDAARIVSVIASRITRAERERSAVPRLAHAHSE